MRVESVRRWIRVVFPLLMLLGIGSVFAAASGSFVFNYAGDAGDNADGPQYDITITSPTDDGSGCDAYFMIMVDSSGVLVDVDPGCVVGTTASDDGDYGVNYPPTSRPITYALFDLDGADVTALNSISEDDPAYLSYVLANGVCLDEHYEDASSSLSALPTLAPYSLCGGGVPVTGCTLAAPAGSVVGEAPLGAQVFWAPGKESNGVVLNPGTYIVIGQDSSETYYKIMLACQFVWVRKDTMQPSYLPPQNGAPLPTRIVG